MLSMSLETSKSQTIYIFEEFKLSTYFMSLNCSVQDRSLMVKVCCRLSKVLLRETSIR